MWTVRAHVNWRHRPLQRLWPSQGWLFAAVLSSGVLTYPIWPNDPPTEPIPAACGELKARSYFVLLNVR